MTRISQPLDDDDFVPKKKNAKGFDRCCCSSSGRIVRRQRCLLFWLMMLLLNSNTRIVTESMAQGIIDLSCDFENDQCSSQVNNVCESELGDVTIAGCERGDCVDCMDRCRDYDFDCTGCQENGCYWCPGDAICFNSDLYVLIDNPLSCTEPSHYFSTTSSSAATTSSASLSTTQQATNTITTANGVFTCNAPDSFFRYGKVTIRSKPKTNHMWRFEKTMKQPATIVYWKGMNTTTHSHHTFCCAPPPLLFYLI
jgi:hypothetical protein